MQTKHAADYANLLLEDLGEDARVNGLSDHPAIAFCRSGLLKTTGAMLPLPLASHADGVMLALKALSSRPEALPQSGSQILGERARLRKITVKGRLCASGHGRLIDTNDGRIALNLVREEDWELIPAWLEDYAGDWREIEKIIKKRRATYLVDRAAELGLAVAKDELPSKPATWISMQHFDKAPVPKRPLIVDLSGLWAAPLATSLLSMTGAKVIKVESPSRPDGMRRGNSDFYNLINAGKECVALEFHNPEALDQLKSLLHKADIVIEASRPRALRQLGIIAEEFVSAKSGKIWARLTAYGPSENRIGFGDDIGISAGLATVMEKAHQEPSFVGDAIADPVNGLHLALALQAASNQGGGVVIDLTMRDVLRHAMAEIPDELAEVAEEWRGISNRNKCSSYGLRLPRGEVKSLGADSAAWL